MSKKPVVKDERIVAAENAAANITLNVIGWLVLVDLFLHGLIPDKINPNGFPLDLLFICLVSGTVNLISKWKLEVFTARTTVMVVTAIVISALISALTAFLMIKL